jgi:flagellar basal-body rod modification protein FlgD
MTRINPYYSPTVDKSKLGNSNLGKDDFLKLLITQLSHQNPLEPMDNRELISQMAQFSSLEQMQNLNQQMASLSAINAIGKSVRALDDNQLEVDGTVTGVVFEKGKTSMLIATRGEAGEEVEVKIPMERVFEMR